MKVVLWVTIISVQAASCCLKMQVTANLNRCETPRSALDFCDDTGREGCYELLQLVPMPTCKSGDYFYVVVQGRSTLHTSVICNPSTKKWTMMGGDSNFEAETIWVSCAPNA